MNKTATYQMRAFASTENLANIREFVSVHAREHLFTEKQINDIRLAVDEACTNVIKHAYKYDDNEQILVHLNFNTNSLTITITDQGSGFNFNNYQKPNLKEQIKQKKRGGMGIYLIRNLMDEVSYYSDRSKNTLTIKKFRNKSA